ncbi:hypothetical protein AVEN_76485-1 [Araneus ventricosus]|uniref:Uncharacterized protein n=1 Tax=Araneus ventricosus TaxID=182803 RepID=A0A4Y2CDL5_ARAVE|nr:hypothetical protein AVEN_76485-1 [Araneus ventricosus]
MVKENCGQTQTMREKSSRIYAIPKIGFRNETPGVGVASKQEPHPWSKKDPFRLAGGTLSSCDSKKLKVLIAASVCNTKLLAILFQEEEQALSLSFCERVTTRQAGNLTTGQNN